MPTPDFETLRALERGQRAIGASATPASSAAGGDDPRGAPMLTVAAGAPFEVALGSAQSTAYMWEPLALPEGVRLLATRFSDKAGCAAEDRGTQVFELQAQRPGRVQLCFVLRRRWEQTPIQSRSINVDVR